MVRVFLFVRVSVGFGWLVGWSVGGWLEGARVALDSHAINT